MIYAGEGIALAPSGDKTGAADAARINGAIASLPVTGGAVTLTAGNWYLVPGAVVISQQAPVYLLGAGRGVTIINAVAGAAGDVIRMLNPVANTGGGSPGTFGGGVGGLTIDGTSAAAASCGLHIGDIEGAQLDVCVQNFTGAGDIGFHIDNTIWWTEKLAGQIYSVNNTSGVVFDMSGLGSSVQNSHAYDDLLIKTECGSGQNGVIFQGGAVFYNGNLKIRGNYNTGSSANACLTITGLAANGPDVGIYSQIRDSRLDIQVESNGLTPFPTTLSFGSVSAGTENAILRCSGIMDFFNTWSGANVFGNSVNATGAIAFDGWVSGDTNLGPAGPGLSLAAAQLYGTGFVTVAATTQVPTQIGDVFFFTIGSVNVTVSLIGYLSGCSAGPQRKTIIIKQNSAGSKTVTWPHNASPTLALPTVLWAGGTPPTMTAAANAVDVYDLETLDGITWYGRATQNVS